MNTRNQLLDLARAALRSDTVLAVDADGHLTRCDPPPGLSEATAVDYGPIVGVVCPAGARAVAYPIDVALSTPPGRVGASIALAVPRHGNPIVTGPDHPELNPGIDVHTMFDLGLRSLGEPTPPADQPLIELLDRIWLDRVLSVTLAADLGFPPRWPHLGSLHPALPSLTNPDRLPRVRSGFTASWESLRRQVATAHIRWIGLPPRVAEWLDEGAFARWCMADTPDPDDVLDDLTDLLDPRLFERIVESLGIGCRPMAAGSSRHGSEL